MFGTPPGTTRFARRATRHLGGASDRVKYVTNKAKHRARLARGPLAGRSDTRLWSWIAAAGAGLLLGWIAGSAARTTATRLEAEPPLAEIEFVEVDRPEAPVSANEITNSAAPDNPTPMG